MHRALQKFFHTALLETASSEHLFRYKVEMYLELYAKISPFHVLRIVAFFNFFHLTVTSFST